MKPKMRLEKGGVGSEANGPITPQSVFTPPSVREKRTATTNDGRRRQPKRNFFYVPSVFLLYYIILLLLKYWFSLRSWDSHSAHHE